MRLALLFHLGLLAAAVAVAADENPGFSASFLADKTITRASWTELVGWSANASKVAGQFSFGSPISASTGRYTAPKSGVYLVTATVKLNSATGSYFRLLVPLNNYRTTNNGMHAIIGRPPSSTYTLTVTGAMQINAKEYISVQIYSASDSNWKILAGSSFNVRYLGPEKSLPGFLADLSAAYKRYRQTGWIEVTEYRTTGYNTGLFSSGTGLSTSSGRFTAPCAGSYFVSANIRLDYATGPYFRIVIAVNGKTDINNGLHAIRGSPPSNYYTMNAAGVVKLNAGDYVSVWINSNSDTSWYLHGESGFSAVFLSDLSQPTLGMHADLTKDLGVGQSGSKEIGGWSSSGLGGQFANSEFNSTSGRFVATADGPYFVSGLVRLDSVNAETKVFVGIDAKEVVNGLQSLWTSPASTYFSYALSGILWLKSGQTISLFVSTKDTNYVVQSESGLSVHSLFSSSSWTAIHVKPVADLSISDTNTWKIVTGWQSTGNKYGILFAGTSFSSSKGIYTAAQTGIYYVSASVHVSGDAGAETRLALAVNGVASSTAGLTAVKQSPPSQTYTLSFSGYVKLSTDDTVSLQMRHQSSAPVTVKTSSDFSVGFAAGPASMPAFAANLMSKVSFSSTGWKELTAYSSSTTQGFFQSQGFGFDSSTGRFTAPSNGTFFATANVEFVNAGGSGFKCTIAVNGKRTTPVNNVDDPNQKSVTCSVAGILKLKANDYVSVFAYSDTDASWDVAAGSSFTAAQQAPKVAYTVGEISSSQPKTKVGWSEISGYSLLSTGRFKASTQGIYYISTQIIVKNANGKYVAARIAVDGNSTSQTPYAIRSSYKGSAPTTLFASGLVYLAENQYVSVYVDSDSDSSYSIIDGSTFYVLQLKQIPDTPAATGYVAASTLYRTTNWVEISTYSLATKPGLFSLDNRFASMGRFYAPNDGLYFVSANIRLDYAYNAFTSANIAINGKVNTSNGLHSRRGYPPSYYYTANIAGTTFLSAGDYLSAFADTSQDTNWYVRADTSFSVHYISPKPSGIGFLADKFTDGSFTGSGVIGWNEISGWHTSGKGLFTAGSGFDATTGRYTVPYTGIYIVAANIELTDAASGVFQASAVVDNRPSNGNGVFSVRQTSPNNYYTHSFSGAMYLAKGQVLSIAVHSSVDTSWKVSEKSGFSAVYHSSYQSVPGFAATLGTDIKVERTGSTQIVKWAKPSTGFGLFQSTTNFDPFSGRFTAPFSGYFFLSANIRLDSATAFGSRNFRLMLVVNGQLSTSSSVVLQALHSSTPGTYTMAASGVLKLNRWDYVAVWVYSSSDSSYTIHADSGFSALFINGDNKPEVCVDNGPKFTIQPTGVSVKIGSSFTLSCLAFGSPAPTYQWTFNGKAISGATNLNYTLSNAQKANGGNYYCEATVAGKVKKTSSAALVRVYDPQPKFAAAIYKASLTENGSTRNRYVTRLYATAETSTLSRQSVRFSFTSGNEKSNFTVRSYYSYYAYIYVNGYLDREAQSFFNLTVKAVSTADSQMTATATLLVTVTDLNDNAPQFNQKVFSANVSESAPIGTTVASISATDGDAGSNGKVTYSIRSGNEKGIFAIDSGTGTVVTTATLDIDQGQLDYQLFIWAQDNPVSGLPLEGTTELRINVVDANDNAPYFTQSIYQQTISEGALVGTTVVHLTALDADLGTNALVTYNISSGNADSAFAIRSSDGIVTVAKTLDRETVAKYQLTVTAVDGGVPSNTGSASLIVTVSDINDNEPTFTVSSYSTSVIENNIVGVRVIQVSASEKDVNSVITYSLASAVKSMFRISSSGVITALQSFDRETRAQYAFNVYAADSAPSPRTGSATVTVNVDDVNDNDPSFQMLPYAETLKETTPIGTSVLTVVATDSDAGGNGSVSYSIRSQKSGFIINSQTGVISTDVPFDFPSRSSYNFTVSATDRGSPIRTSTAQVVVAITDVNNHAPTFSLAEYSVPVKESASSSSTLLRLSASDDDAGVNAKISYAIVSGNVGNKFKIDSVTGDLILDGSLDYEVLSDYDLTILATDAGFPVQTGVTTVDVEVIDVNDNSPTFTQSQYVTSVSAFAPNGTQIATVRATDKDSGSNGRLLYSLTSGNSKGNFAIDSSSGEVSTTVVLGLSPSSYQLGITASDKGNPSKQAQCLLTVTVFKDDANVLNFDLDLYTATIAENAAVNSSVTSVLATTQSGPVFVAYSISNPGKVPFRMTSNSGQITVLKSLDRETTPVYNFVVVAKSSGPVPQTAQANVRVAISDVNDNAPTFSPQKYAVTIPESTSPGTSVAAVTATDKDSGSNGRFSYSLLGGAGGYFSLNKALGDIMTAAVLNTSHIRNFSLIIKATDQGDPALFSTTTVGIQVAVQGNTKPRFSTDRYTFIVQESVGSGSLVGTVVVHDPDPGPYGKATFKILSGNDANLFVINSNTGVIQTAKQLDYETDTSYLLEIEAVDGGRPSKSATTKVSVIVTDVNDNSPIFSNTPYSVTISDQLPLGSSVFQVTATDKDSGTNGDVSFSIAKGNANSRFAIERNTGVISLAGSLDSAKQSAYSLIVRAADGGASQRSETTAVTVNVVKPSQLKPVFDQSVYSVSLPENFDLAVSVTRVRARETLGSSGIRYSLSDSTVFGVDATTGIVSLSRRLDRETKDQYSITVVATDQRQPPQSSTAQLNVAVQDVNDNQPVFSLPVYSASIYEGDQIGKSVITIQATDSDIGANGKITYSIIQGNIDNAFSIDPSTGLVSNLIPMDREQTSKYVLRIAAADQGSSSLQAVTSLTVAILDVNDNAPVFSQPIYSDSVDENVAIGAPLLTVTATDDDVGSNALIKYSIESDGNLPFLVGTTTGLVVSADVLSGGQYRFKVVATDQGSPAMTSTCDVVLDVATVNKHNPVFDKEVYEKTIHSSTPVGTVVLTVSAVDSDDGLDGRVRYFIDNETESLGELLPFSISRDSGDIKLDRLTENGESFSFAVIAVDSGENLLSSTATVKIDVNNQVAPTPISNENTGNSGGLNVGLIAGVAIGTLVLLLLIVIIVVVAKKKAYAFKWRRNEQDDEIPTSVAFTPDGDNIAFTNPMYGGSGVTKQNPLYEAPFGSGADTMESKHNPIYSSTDDVLDRIQAELDMSLAKGFEDEDD